jgi:signal transduction histidine kinase
MIALLSTVQRLPDDERAAVERALVPLARRAAIGALAADIAHDAGNALFGLVGLLDLMVADEPVGGRRKELLQTAAGDLDAAFRPLLHFVRAGDDEGRRGDLAAMTRDALSLYRHGEHKLTQIDEEFAVESAFVACPPSLVAQAVVHLLLGSGTVERVVVETGCVRVAQVGPDSLDEVVARRIAVDHGGSLERDNGEYVLRLPAA